MKGAVVACTVRALRRWRRERPDTPLPALSLGARALLETRIDPKLWYAYDEYLELMLAIRDSMLDGKTESLCGFAAAGAPLVYRGPHSALIVPDDPFNTIREIKAIWGSCHDFGRPEVEVGATDVLVRIADALPMCEAEGQIIMGWIRGALEVAGASGIEAEIEEAPWEGESLLAIRYAWDFRGEARG